MAHSKRFCRKNNLDSPYSYLWSGILWIFIPTFYFAAPGVCPFVTIKIPILCEWNARELNSTFRIFFRWQYLLMIIEPMHVTRTDKILKSRWSALAMFLFLKVHYWRDFRLEKPKGHEGVFWDNSFTFPASDVPESRKDNVLVVMEESTSSNTFNTNRHHHFHHHHHLHDHFHYQQYQHQNQNYSYHHHND